MGQFARVAILSLTIVVVGQSAHAAKIGVKAGYGFTRPSYEVSGTDVTQAFADKGGFSLGLSYADDLGPVEGFVDLLYTSRALGFKNTDQTFHYIEVPLMLNGTIGMLRINGGGYFAYGIGSIKSCFNSTCATASYGETTTTMGGVAATYSRIDYGLVGGIGILFPFPDMELTLDLRVHYGLKDFGGDNITAKWRGLDAIAGIAF